MLTVNQRLWFVSRCGHCCGEPNDTLSDKPETGTALGNDTHKIRLAIKRKRKGKSDGGRVITYVVKDNEEVYLLTIFDKSEFASIDDKTLKNEIRSLYPGD